MTVTGRTGHVISPFLTRAVVALLFTMGFGGPARGHADDASVRVELAAPPSCGLAARCDVRVRVMCPPGAECALPPVGRLGPFEVIEVADVAGPDARAAGSREWRLVLLAFEPGPARVPGVSVRATLPGRAGVLEVRSAEATVAVEMPSLPEDAALRGTAAPLDPGTDWRVPAAWAGGVLGVLFVAALAWRVWRRLRATAAPRGVSAAETLAELRRLKTTPVGSPEDVLALYSGLSTLLRRYLAMTLTPRAPALTSQEIVGAIGERADDSTTGDAWTLLSEVDAVKFGRVRPGHERRVAAVERAAALAARLGDLRPPPATRREDVD